MRPTRRAALGLVVLVGAAGGLAIPACDTVLGIGRFDYGCPDAGVGARRCSGNLLQTCAESGSWTEGTACPFVCIDDQCLGTCVPRQMGCAGNAPQVCDELGQWQSAGAPCDASTCDPDAGACVGECAPGGKRCGGETPQGCDGTGHWDGGAPCDADAGTHCSGGACVVTCTAGDLQCLNDYTPQQCQANGDWQSLSLCDPCKQCDPATGACRASYLPDETSCQDPQDRCVLSATCLDQVCTADPDGGVVQCVNAGVCGPSECVPATGTCPAPSGIACDDGDVCTVSSACQDGVCAGTPPSDRAWAHWNLTALPPSPRYTWTDHVVFDAVTGLTWQRNVPLAAYTWANATSYCACLNGVVNNVQCGDDRMPEYPSGWRLPKRIELVSIVDYEQDPMNSPIDPVAFPGTPADYFWTSSLYVDDPTQAWYADFTNLSLGGPGGSVSSYPLTLTNRLRCVR